MSRPVCRTALREVWNRRVSPSSAQITTDSSGPYSCSGLVLQLPAAGLTAGELGQLLAEAGQLCVEGVDDVQRDGDGLAA